jgi:hypothetical protein
MTDETKTEQQEPKVDFDLDLHTYRLLQQNHSSQPCLVEYTRFGLPQSPQPVFV